MSPSRGQRAEWKIGDTTPQDNFGTTNQLPDPRGHGKCKEEFSRTSRSQDDNREGVA
jgi:hypothetical protein